MPAPAVQAVQEDETPMNMPIPQVNSPDVSPADSDQESVPSIPPVIAFPEGSDYGLDAAKKLGSAFRTVANAQTGFQAYKGTTAFGIVNKTGTQNFVLWGNRTRAKDTKATCSARSIRMLRTLRACLHH